MQRRLLTSLTAGILFSASLLSAQQIVATDTAQAGPDFPFQGEYQGEVTAAGGQKSALVAQVVAQGNGSFKAVLFAGGFPGSPGHLAASRVQATGTRSGDRAPLSGAGYTLSLTKTGITGTGPSQATVSLARVNRASPTLGLPPPTGAVVLFNGTSLSAWRSGAAMDARGLLGVPATTATSFGNFSLHLEFLLPFEPSGRGQGRGNSGIIMNTGGFSEIQVLDSFGDVPYMDGCGALFSTAAPLFEANLPPLTWQTYDINVTAPATTGDARVTVRHNGVIVQNKTILRNRRATTTIELQDHDHPVFYRNIWILNRDDYEPPTSIKPRERLQARHGGQTPLDRLLVTGGAVHPGPSARWNGIWHDLTGRTALERVPAPANLIMP